MADDFLYQEDNRVLTAVASWSKDRNAFVNSKNLVNLRIKMGEYDRSFHDRVEMGERS